MKNSIKFAAILLIAGAGFLAAAPAKAIGSVAPSKPDVITFSSLPSEKGIDIKVEKTTPGKTIVIVYDADGNAMFKDVIKNKSMEKAYILNKLENGDYTIEVTSDKQVVKKQVHVYDENYRKMFIISE